MDVFGPFAGFVQGLGQVDRGEEIHFHDAAVHRFAGFQGRGALGNTGVEHQIVERTIQRRDKSVDGRVVGGVGFHEADIAGAELSADGSHAVLTDFFAAAFNPTTGLRYFHVITAALVLGGLVAVSIAASAAMSAVPAVWVKRESVTPLANVPVV